MTRERLSRRAVLRSGTAGAAALAGFVGTGVGATAGAPPAERFEAGAARVDASPQQRHFEEGVYLGGFGIGPQPSRRAIGNRDGVSARALAVSAGDEAVAMAVLDVTGLGNRQQRAIRRRSAERTGLDPSQVLVSVTHTHAGPDFQGLWGGVPASYREYLVERTVRSIERAVAAREPARAFVGSVDAADLAANRRVEDFGTVSTLTALQFRRVRGDDTVATFVNFAAHPTIVGSGNARVATDYVGPLERAVEREQGGVAVYFNGAIGDASADDSGGATDYAAAAGYGESLAARADDALAEAGRVHAGLAAREASVRLPIDNCLFKTAFESGLLRPYYDAETVTGTATERVFGSAPEAGALAIDSPVVRLTIGDRRRSVELLTVPGEAVTRLGRDLVDVLSSAGSDEQVIAGLTQNSIGYLVPKPHYEDGYEETVSLGPDTAPLYRNTVAELYDLDRTRYERLPPGTENVCPAGQAQFESFAGEFGQRFDADDGPMGVDVGGTP
ncbi:hypothetical protein BRC90_04455 [Halobacteriales archaeon QS_4_69_34]|nr:MAG: hypothetical protein BRC90_04455 [Halobacteriales archaeon QS_4_69_34]